jgi:hypothetical protein
VREGVSELLSWQMGRVKITRIVGAFEVGPTLRSRMDRKKRWRAKYRRLPPFLS